MSAGDVFCCVDFCSPTLLSCPVIPVIPTVLSLWNDLFALIPTLHFCRVPQGKLLAYHLLLAPKSGFNLHLCND